MKSANNTRIQIAAAILSFASLIGVAATAPTGAVANETQSFIGTTPDASTVEAQPSTF